MSPASPPQAEPPYRVDAYPPELAGVPWTVYRRVGQKHLRLWFRYPEADVPRPLGALLFFFGGGFRVGTPSQFDYQARTLAATGLVGIMADYRVQSRDGVNAAACVDDSRAAMAFVRGNAQRLGLDPSRIGAAGGSAGGALAAGLVTFARPADGRGADALALYNPALTCAPLPGRYEFDSELVEMFERMAGVPAESISATHHLRPDLPPTLIMHGDADQLIPHATARAFKDVADKLGADCELVTYAGADHGFFNSGASPGNELLRQTTLQLLQFLGRIGWIEEGLAAG